MNNKLALPLSIVAAALIIGGAIYMSKDSGPERPDITAKIDLAAVTQSDHIIGNRDAKVVAVEYSDTECPACKSFQPGIERLVSELKNDGTLALVYRHFPLDQIHKKARSEAQAAECAGKVGGQEKFWAYIDEIFKVTPSNDRLDPAELPKIASRVGVAGEAWNTCVKSDEFKDVIENDLQSGIKAGVMGTPTTFFIVKNGISGEAENFLYEMVDTFSKQMGERAYELVKISEDKKVVKIFGALQYENLAMIVSALAK